MKLNELVVNAKNKVSAKAGMAGLKMQKYSPEIKMVVGSMAFIGSLALAYRAGTRAKEAINRYNVAMDDIHTAEKNMQENPDVYVDVDETTIAQATFAARVDLAKDLGKDLAPVIGLAALSLGFMISSNNTLKKRYVGAVAAYNAVTRAFEKYRINVKDRFGEEVDYELKNGIVSSVKTVETTDEKGKKKTKEEIVKAIDPSRISDQAVWFEEGNPDWNPYHNYNLAYLKAQQSLATEILLARGHIFLNDVYQMLNLPDTSEGAVVGWVKGMGDDYVDFGLYDDRNIPFINGEKNRVLLDFNHDGVIWDKI